MLNLVYNFKNRMGERRWERKGEGREREREERGGEGKEEGKRMHNMFYCLTGEPENSTKVQDNELASRRLLQTDVASVGWRTLENL